MRNTIEELTRENSVHIDIHGPLTEEDINIINRLSDNIENGRGMTPMVGDAVEIFTREGVYFPHAHIDHIDEDGNIVVCASGGLAIAYADGTFSKVSGGPWMTLKKDRLAPNGEYIKEFQHYRPAGFTSAHALMTFQAKIGYWIYREPDPLYGTYSEKDYDMCVHHFVKDDACPNRYKHDVSGRRFDTAKEYLAWLTTYKGVEFAGEFCNIVFVYKKKEILLDKAEWDTLDLPTDSRMFNANIIPIKFYVDDDKHCITEYRYTNRGTKDEYLGPEYRVARAFIEENAVELKVFPQCKSKKA